MHSIFYIQGNIGSGKSTLIELVVEQFQAKGKKVWVLDEPLDEWTMCKNLHGEGLIESFYGGRTSAFAFQLVCQMTRLNKFNKMLEKLESESEEVVVVAERNVDVGNFVFGVELVLSLKMSLQEQELVVKLCNRLKPLENIEEVEVFLNTSPKLCLERINKRSRIGEGGLELDFLRSIDHHYYNHLGNVKRKIILDGKNSPREICSEFFNKV